MNERTITIISTRTWESNTLFDKRTLTSIDDKGINEKLESFFGQINWTRILDDSELTKLWVNFIHGKTDYPIEIEDLQNDQTARDDAFEINEVRDYVCNNEKYKKEIDRRKLYQVKDTDVYGIKALDASRNAKEWIPTLLDVAKLLCPNTEGVNVNLFLHDKDITNGDYYQTVIEAEAKDVFPDNKNAFSYGIQNCTVVFFKHTINPIMELISNPASKNISDDINNAINAVRCITEMIADSKKDNE